MSDERRQDRLLPTFRQEGLTVPVRDEYLPMIEEAEAILGHLFVRRALLVEALLHPSMREREDASYERLEFLGDAVLGLVVAEDLFHRFPDSDEGELTRVKSMVVSRAALAKMGRSLRIADLLILGKGMQHHEAIPRSVIANCTEALIGAVYVDAGLEAAREFVMSRLDDRIRQAVRRRDVVNHKSSLQQWAQKRGLGTPIYQVQDVRGPDHERTFQVFAVVDGREFLPSKGLSKKAAEQRAARTALRLLEAESAGAGD